MSLHNCNQLFMIWLDEWLFIMKGLETQCNIICISLMTAMLVLLLKGFGNKNPQICIVQKTISLTSVWEKMTIICYKSQPVWNRHWTYPFVLQVKLCLVQQGWAKLELFNFFHGVSFNLPITLSMNAEICAKIHGTYVLTKEKEAYGEVSK